MAKLALINREQKRAYSEEIRCQACCVEGNHR